MNLDHVIAVYANESFETRKIRDGNPTRVLNLMRCFPLAQAVNVITSKIINRACYWKRLCHPDHYFPVLFVLVFFCACRFMWPGAYIKNGSIDSTRFPRVCQEVMVQPGTWSDGGSWFLRCGLRNVRAERLHLLIVGRGGCIIHVGSTPSSDVGCFFLHLRIN